MKFDHCYLKGDKRDLNVNIWVITSAYLLMGHSNKIREKDKI